MGDPHNGYGPNRFRRLAAAGQEIVLFGEGAGTYTPFLAQMKTLWSRQVSASASG
jgi:hypothetical protein